jgi:hypothetical protein
LVLLEIPELSDAEWQDLLQRLTLYADGKLRKLWWRGETYSKDASVPGGITADDLAASAIESFLDGSRTWDKNAEANLLRFLEGVIDSKVSHLVIRAENKRSRRLNTSQQANQPAFHLEAKGGKPDQIVADRESLEKLKNILKYELEKDDMAMFVLECFEANITKPQEISELRGVDISEINNAQRRLRRVAKKACENLGRPIP